MFCGWEGNRRSGITLAVCHRLCGISTYELMAKGREMSTLSTLLQFNFTI